MEWFIELLYWGISREIPIGVVILNWVMVILGLISFPYCFFVMAVQGTKK